jgi:hypothetical protein
MDLHLERRVENSGWRYPNRSGLGKEGEKEIKWGNDEERGHMPLLPRRFAKLVTLGTKGMTLVLRLGYYVTDVSVDSAKVGTLTVLGIVRRAVDGVVYKAAADVPGSTGVGDKALKAIDRAAISGTLMVAASFQFTASLLATINFLTQDVLHFINGVVGATDTSIAIRSIGSLVAKELGDWSAVYALFTGLAYFTILQSRGRNREKDEIEAHVIWDIVVLDDGGTVAKRTLPSPGSIIVPEEEVQINSLITRMPENASYRIKLDEYSTRMFSIQVVYPPQQSRPIFKFPLGHKVLVEETISSDADGDNVYNVVFESSSVKSRENVGKGPYIRSSITDVDIEDEGNELVTSTPHNSSLAHRQFFSQTPFISPFPNGNLACSLAKYMRYSAASYGQSFMRLFGIRQSSVKFSSSEGHHSEHHSFSDHARLSLDDILLSSFVDSAVEEKCGIPLVHFITVDHDAKVVVLTIRGTLGLEDLLADFKFGYDSFEWNNQRWIAHGGMLKCANILIQPSCRVLQTLKDALESFGPDYGLIICGHSLGAGVGAIYAILLSEIEQQNSVFVTSKTSPLPPGRRIRCFSYGPPASISEELRKITKDLITSVVYGSDIIPCLSLGLLRDFQAVAQEFRDETSGVNRRIWRTFISQLGSKKNPIDQQDDYTYSILKTLRAIMQNKKLVPPGEIIHITTHTVYENRDGHKRKASRIIGKVILDVEKKFREIVLGRGIFQHAPNFYEAALNTLERGAIHSQ